MNTRNVRFWPVLTILIVVLLPPFAGAVPYVPLEQAEYEAQLRADSMPVGPLRMPSGLDELEEYVGTIEYYSTLNWLTTFQVLEDGEDLGGQREGESTTNWDIIQTDNTQEALRDWSWYASTSGDLTTFESYVENAWTYTLNFPAYLEEGGGNPNYYRVHNSGWGLVATMEYTEAYGENETYIAYGDSCARYINNWRLSWSGTDVELNPLAAGFGAGTLYLYGVWRDNEDWIAAAQDIAGDVKAWIEANPDRLNSNETWAMSGGTAMWGVVTALYLDDPDAGAAWIPTVSSSMDTYSGPGSWNNSWTVWYGHAWAAIHRVLGDQTSYDNMIEVINYLLDQVHLDDDPGMPGTQGQWADDQSWTSAYLLWYVLESLFEFDDTSYDAVAYEVVSPTLSWPLVSGNPVSITVRLANGGMQHLVAPDQAVSVQLQSPAGTSDPTVTDIRFGQTVDVIFSDVWTPTEAGNADIRVIATTANDELQTNDTLDVTFEIVEGRSISGVVLDEQFNPIEASLHWVQTDVNPERNGVVYSDAETGNYTIQALPGEYEIAMEPVHAPYLGDETSVTVTTNDVHGVNFTAHRAPWMVVSADGDPYIIEALVEALAEVESTEDLTPYVWSISEKGQPDDTLNTVDAVLWTSGNTNSGVINASQYDAINNYMSMGGCMLLSGDGVMNGSDSDILHDLFHVDLGEEVDFNSSIVDGARTTALARNDSLFIVGPSSIQAVDELVPVDHAVVEFISQTDDYPLVVSCDNGWSGRTVVMSFGLEAINSQTRFVTREEFLTRVVNYFFPSGDAPEQGGMELPGQLALSAHPNPFNPTLTIEVAVPQHGGQLTVFDLLGRQVAAFDLQQGSRRILWRADRVASGTYFVRLNAGTQEITRRVTLLR